MSAQNRYSFSSPIGAAGGLVDLTPHAIDTFINEEENGSMKFGIGVVRGTKPGSTIVLPEASSTADLFEGITTNNRTTEYDLEGKLNIRKGVAVGVMRYGKIYARVAADVEPQYGDTAYLIVSGEEAGFFTNVAPSAKTDGQSEDPDKTDADADAEADAPSAIAVKARFLGGVDTSAQIAVIELFNQAQM